MQPEPHILPIYNRWWLELDAVFVVVDLEGLCCHPLTVGEQKAVFVFDGGEE